MPFFLHATPSFGGDETQVTVEGPEEATLTKLLASRLVALDYEVLIEDAEGDMVPVEDFEEFPE